VQQVVGVTQDITERKRASQALHRSEERYRSLVEATATLVFVVAGDGRVGTDSPQSRAFTGLPFDAYKGFAWLDAVHPDDRAHVMEGWHRAIAETTPVNVEHRLRHHSGA